MKDKDWKISIPSLWMMCRHKIDYDAYTKGGGRMCTLFEGIARENEIIRIEKEKAEGLYG